MSKEAVIVNNTFSILSGFLERFGDEVEGRELSEPTPEARAKLEQLARGTLPEPEQAGIWALLKQNPQWVVWLAQEVKAHRSKA
jgi:hypothetical protein